MASKSYNETIPIRTSVDSISLLQISPIKIDLPKKILLGILIPNQGTLHLKCIPFQKFDLFKPYYCTHVIFHIGYNFSYRM